MKTKICIKGALSICVKMTIKPFENILARHTFASKLNDQAVLVYHLQISKQVFENLCYNLLMYCSLPNVEL